MRISENRMTKWFQRVFRMYSFELWFWKLLETPLKNIIKWLEVQGEKLDKSLEYWDEKSVAIKNKYLLIGVFLGGMLGIWLGALGTSLLIFAIAGDYSIWEAFLMVIK